MKFGSLIMMREQYPCKVTQISTSKPGKHGSAKANVIAKDIFTDKQYEESFGTGDMVPRPIVTTTEVVAIAYDEDDSLALLLANGELKEDLDLP